MRYLFCSITLAFAAAACADDLRPGNPDAGPGTGADASPAGEHITHTDNGDGTTTTVVDASDEAAWIYLDLQTKQEKTPMNPAASDGWDLAFHRFEIKINGGDSGAGGMEVAVLEGADFDALAEAPAAGYVTDAADGDDEDTAPDLAFTSGDSLWYDYDPSTHVLTPRDLVYVLASVEGDYFKLRILTYYDEVGTAGFLKFQWGPVAAPSGQD